MKKILCLVGPTSSGKTDLAVKIVYKFGGAIISADSVQVYKQLDIISGKDIPEGAKSQACLPARQGIKVSKYSIGYFEFNNVKLYLTDVVDSTKSFSVHDYVTVARPVIESIENEGKLPIIVGGTGFYVKALLDGVETLAAPLDQALREQLQSYKVTQLQSILEKESKGKLERMNNSDRNNPRRLVRAIEIERYSKTSLNQTQNDAQNAISSKYEILIIGLAAPREILNRRIDERVEKRLKMGAVSEASKLFKQYNNLSNSVKTANGYRQLFEYLQGKCTLEAAIENWKNVEHLNAKKQMTWFKKDKRIVWFDITEKNYIKRIEDLIGSWLGKNAPGRE